MAPRTPFSIPGLSHGLHLLLGLLDRSGKEHNRDRHSNTHPFEEIFQDLLDEGIQVRVVTDSDPYDGRRLERTAVLSHGHPYDKLIKGPITFFPGPKGEIPLPRESRPHPDPSEYLVAKFCDPYRQDDRNDDCPLPESARTLIQRIDGQELLIVNVLKELRLLFPDSVVEYDPVYADITLWSHTHNKQGQPVTCVWRLIQFRVTRVQFR